MGNSYDKFLSPFGTRNAHLKFSVSYRDTRTHLKTNDMAWGTADHVLLLRLLFPRKLFVVAGNQNHHHIPLVNFHDDDDDHSCHNH